MAGRSIRQRARVAAREAEERQRLERTRRDRRVRATVEAVLVALGERDEAVERTERVAGTGLAELTHGEGLTLTQAVAWCADTLTVREATRLRRLATEGRDSPDRPGGGPGPGDPPTAGPDVSAHQPTKE